MTIPQIRMPSMDYSRPSVQSVAPANISSLNQAQNMAETNALLRELLNKVSIPQEASLNIDGNKAGDLLFPGIMHAGNRRGQPLTVKQR